MLHKKPSFKYVLAHNNYVEFMPNVTLSVSDETRKRMLEHPEVRWSNAIRAVIERKLDDFEVADRLAGKSLVTENDAKLLAAKVDSAMARHAKGLLDEGNC